MCDILLSDMKNCKGNALVYILLAVALMAALTFAISGDNRGSQQNQLSASQVKLMANELINHATSAEMAVQQMTQWGISYDEIKFDLPGTPDYNTDITRQIYHPSGGGLSLMQNLKKYKSPEFETNTTWMSWTFKNVTNVDWTQTSDTDAIYSFGGIHPDICAEINRQLHNFNDSYDAPGVSFRAAFLWNNPSNKDFEASDCLDCEFKSNACIKKTTDEFRIFYNIIGSR